MAKLTEPEKHFIIEKLAQFCSHAEVVRLLKSELDVAVDRFQIRTLDPTHPRFAGSEKLRELFDAYRAAYLDNINDLPIASDAFRLRQLQDFFLRARDLGNMGLALKILKQAEEASEKINSKIPSNMTPRPAYMDLSPEERRSQAAEFLHKLLARNRVPDEERRERVSTEK